MNRSPEVRLLVAALLHHELRRRRALQPIDDEDITGDVEHPLVIPIALIAHTELEIRHRARLEHGNELLDLGQRKHFPLVVRDLEQGDGVRIDDAAENYPLLAIDLHLVERSVHDLDALPCHWTTLSGPWYPVIGNVGPVWLRTREGIRAMNFRLYTKNKIKNQVKQKTAGRATRFMHTSLVSMRRLHFAFPINLIPINISREIHGKCQKEKEENRAIQERQILKLHDDVEIRIE